MKSIFIILALPLLLFSLVGCSAETVGQVGSVSLIYGVITLLSVALLVCYFSLVHKKDLWFSFLFILIPLINLGYFWLSMSASLSEALWANRLSYFASVFLPLTMLMIICKVTGTSCRKSIVWVLLAVSVAMFLLTASPGILDVYYKDVTLIKGDGFSYLSKVYGPFHVLYLFYLLFYFSAVLGTTAFAILKKKLRSRMHAILLTLAVFVNIGVWGLGQLTDLEFEFLSVSYFISELFLLGLQLLMQENERILSQKNNEFVLATMDLGRSSGGVPVESVSYKEERIDAQRLSDFRDGLLQLTKTEKTIYHLYLERKNTKEIMMQLEITENTLKYHNKNLYGKLGVSSRKELLALSTLLEKSSFEKGEHF
jgi:DNA-binding CsgD family transcriptional regulator